MEPFLERGSQFLGEAEITERAGFDWRRAAIILPGSRTNLSIVSRAHS
jgi:hypothetical protein